VIAERVRLEAGAVDGAAEALRCRAWRGVPDGVLGVGRAPHYEREAARAAGVDAVVGGFGDAEVEPVVVGIESGAVLGVRADHWKRVFIEEKLEATRWS
jgi:hypothetical protein